jgi:hypothetical protein
VKVDLCPDSWIKVEALIGRAAFDEREHLLTIARKVSGCKCQRCRRAAAQLRAAVKSTDPWTWFQDVLK